jgi:predicted nucleic acid-binding protein
LELTSADWHLAAEIKADGGISLADAYAVALAYDRDATLVAGADDDFDELPVDIELRRFRDSGV